MTTLMDRDVSFALPVSYCPVVIRTPGVLPDRGSPDPMC